MSSITERLATLLNEWRDDPVAFVREMFGAEPDTWQAEFMRAVASHDRVAVRSGHGVGKSTAVAWLILWFAHTRRPFKIPVTGSNFDQLQSTTWAEVGAWMRKAPPPFQRAWNYTTESFKLIDAPEECFAVLRTAAKERSQNLAGFHSENVLVVVDEASAVDDLIYEVLSGALTTPGAKLVLTGNPTQASGKFYDVFHEQRAGWKTFHVPTFGSKWVGPGWIEEQAANYGEHSNAYRVRVLGEFPSSDDDGVIPLELIESAVDRDVQPIQSVRPIWGVDVAWMGSDRSSLAKRQGNAQLEPIKAWRGKDPAQLSGIIHAEWLSTTIDTRPAEIVVDIIGIGAGVAANLEKEGLPIRRCNVAEAAAVGDRFSRLRDELWWKGRQFFEARDCRILKDDALIAELSLPKYEILPNGKIKIESKADMAKRGVRSPDLADAWIMTFAGNERSTRFARSQTAHHSRAPERPWNPHDPR